MTPARRIALALAASATFALPAAAQTSSADQPGFYAGGGLGWNNDSESTFRLFGGYQINRNFAAEFGYHDLGQHNIGGQPLDSDAFELVGVGRLPFNDQLSAYAKLGAYRARSQGFGIDEKTNDLTFGAGVEYGITRNVSARGEWQRYRDIAGGGVGAGSDLDVLSVGVVYRFQ